MFAGKHHPVELATGWHRGLSEVYVRAQAGQYMEHNAHDYAVFDLVWTDDVKYIEGG